MTIIRCKQQVSGNVLEGFQISCHNPLCHCANFFPSKKHLPEQVVANKFRERNWEVNSSGKDFCPNCILTKRHPRKKAAKEQTRVIPMRDRIFLNAKALHDVIHATGLPRCEVIELEGAGRRFKITFVGASELQIGQIIHAEGEAVEAFSASLIKSYLKHSFVHKVEKNIVTLEAALHWYLELELQQRLEAAE